jgi:hypothetical protein
MAKENEQSIGVVFAPPLEHPERTAKEWLDSMNPDDKEKFLKHIVHDRAYVFKKSETTTI